MSEATAEDLARSPLFVGVPGPALAALAAHGVVRRVEHGQRLLATGQPNGSLFVVLAGAVDVLVPGGDAPHVRLSAGECVGELSVIDGQPVSADVVAVGPTTVVELPYDAVWDLIDLSAEFARNLLRTLASRVRHDDVALARSSDRRRHFEQLSMVDGLTGIQNRRWLDAVCPPQLARLLAEGRGAALLMMDVDHFKAFNDRHGHAAGDALLRHVAGTLAEGVRPGDVAARYGGEEFIALLQDVAEPEAVAVAERIRRGIERTIAPDAAPCTISIGVAVAGPSEPFEALLRRADAALFRAKHAGRNRVAV